MLLPYAIVRMRTLVSGRLMVSGHAPLLSMDSPHTVHAFRLLHLSTIA